jgi:hypothetical protein
MGLFLKKGGQIQKPFNIRRASLGRAFVEVIVIFDDK